MEGKIDLMLQLKKQSHREVAVKGKINHTKEDLVVKISWWGNKVPAHA